MGKKMMLGYIVRYRHNCNGDKFGFQECAYTRKITSRGDRVYSKMLMFPVEYEDVEDNTEQMRERGFVLVGEPFFLDEQLREKAMRWVAWANKADPSEYDPFAE